MYNTNAFRGLLLLCGMFCCVFIVSRDADASEPISYTLQGVVHFSNGTPVRGVTVTLASGRDSRTILTDLNGRYAFEHVLNGIYTVTPAKTGNVFRPDKQQVTISRADRSGVDFVAYTGSLSISGRVLQKGAGLRGVAMKLSGVLQRTVTTGADGSYLFSGLPEGRYTVTPALNATSFTPALQDLALTGGNRTGVDFAAASSLTGTIAGKVTVAATPPPDIPAVRQQVRLSGTVEREMPTDASGNYRFSGLPAGTYRIDPTPSFPGPVNPPWRTIDLPAGETRLGMDFRSTCYQMCMFSGRVTRSGVGLANVLIRMTGSSIVAGGSGSLPTDASGKFEYQIPVGSYTLTPQLEGYRFTPASRSFTLRDSVARELNFEAAPVP